jgi:chromosome segregation ATPase
MDNGRTIFIIVLIMGFATLANSIPLTMKDVESNATQLQIQLKKISREAQDLITLLDQTALNNVSGFSRPVSNAGSSTTVLSLQNSMSEIQTKFTDMEKKLFGITDQQTNNREQLSSLENELRSLSVRLDAEKKEAAQTVEGHGSTLTELTASLNSLKRKVEALDEKVKANEQQQGQTNRLPDECIKDIKSHNFKTAEKILELMNDKPSKIKYIVKEVYKSQVENFHLILQFGDSVSNIKMSLQILQALEFEMESSGDKDPLRMMLLVEKLKEKNLQASSFIAKFNDAAVTENPLNSTEFADLFCMIVMVISIFHFFVILYIFVKVVRMCSQTCGQGMPSPDSALNL